MASSNSAVAPWVRPHRLPPARDSWFAALFAVFVGGVWSAVSVDLMVASLQAVVAEVMLIGEGVTTEAVVVARRQERDQERERSILTLEYKAPLDPAPAARPFRLEASVSPEFYASIRKGSELPVLYARTDPAVSRLAAEWSVGVLFWPVIWTVLSVVPFLSLGVGITLSGIKRFGDQVWLARCGLRSKGRVVDCWVGTCGEGNPYPCVAYHFLSPGGRPHHKAEQVDDSAYRRLAPGSEVLVEFVPQRPEICRLVLR